MIGYVVLGTNDLQRAASFYDSLLGEIGLTRQMNLGERGYGWGKDMDAVMLCLMKPFNGQTATVGNGTMTALTSSKNWLTVTVTGLAPGTHTFTASTAALTSWTLGTSGNVDFVIPNVPDAGSTLALLGISLLGLFKFRRRQG